MTGPTEFDWLLSQLSEHPTNVGTFVPRSFERHLRIMHRCYMEHWRSPQTKVRWSEIATATGGTVPSLLRGLRHGGRPPQAANGELFCEELAKQLWHGSPVLGIMPIDDCLLLSSILANHTTTPHELYFGMWEGDAGLQYPSDTLATLLLPYHRRYHICARAIDKVCRTFVAHEHPVNPDDRIYQVPNIWWPKDRAWYVATEIDYTWTYVGCSRACFDAILACDQLEAIPTSPTEGNFAER